MKLKTFIAFSGLTLAALLAAVAAVHNRDAAPAQDADAAGQPLIPGLAQRLNQVTVLALSAGAQSVTLARSDPESRQWSIVEKSGYAADPDSVRRAILALAGARTAEPRTADPAQYSRLALGDEAATLVTLRGADGSELPGLAIGKTVSAATPDHPGSFYARRGSERQTWLAEGRLPPLSADPLQWLVRDLPSMARGRVASVTVDRGGGDTLTIGRKDPATADFTLSGPSRPGKPRQTKINDLAGAAEFLTLEDVAVADSTAKATTVTTTLRSFEGEALTIRVSRRDGHAWASFSATLDGAARSPEAEQRVKEIQQRTATWSYRLSDAAAKDLAPSVDELIEAAKPDETAAKKK